MSEGYSDDESEEEIMEEEMQNNKLEDNTNILAQLLGFFNTDDDIQRLQEILTIHFGEDIQSPQNKIFLNSAYSIEDLKQHIIDHYEDDDIDTKNEFFDSLIDALEVAVQEKKWEEREDLRSARAILENKMKMKTTLHEKINTALKGKEKKQLAILKTNIIKPLISKNLADSTPRIILRDIQSTINTQTMNLEEEIKKLNRTIHNLKLESDISLEIKKEDTTSKKKFLETVNPKLLKQWVKDFYDSAHFRLMFDKNACDNITLSKLTQIAKDNNISLASKHKETIKYAVPLSKWDKKAEQRKKMYDKTQWKERDTEETVKTLTKQEKCNRIFQKLSEGKNEPYIIGGKIFYFRKPFKKSMSFVYYLQQKGIVDKNRTLAVGMSSIRCPTGYKTWSNGTLCCGGLDGQIINTGEDEVGVSRCFTTKINPKVEKIDKEIKKAKKGLKTATTKKDVKKFENQINRLSKQRDDFPTYLEVQHTESGGPKVCALVPHTSYDMCSTYKNPKSNPLYNVKVWKLLGNIYTDKKVSGSSGDFKEYLKAYVKDLVNKYKNSKTPEWRKKEIKSNARDIQQYLNTELIEKFTLLNVSIPKVSTPIKKKKITKKEEDTKENDSKEIKKIKDFYNIPYDYKLQDLNERNSIPAIQIEKLIKKKISKDNDIKEQWEKIQKLKPGKSKPLSKTQIQSEVDTRVETVIQELRKMSSPESKGYSKRWQTIDERKKIEAKQEKIEVKSKRPVFTTYLPPKVSKSQKSVKSKDKLDLETKKLKLKESRDRITEKNKKIKAMAKASATKSKPRTKSKKPPFIVRTVHPFDYDVLKRGGKGYVATGEYKPAKPGFLSKPSDFQSEPTEPFWERKDKSASDWWKYVKPLQGTKTTVPTEKESKAMTKWLKIKAKAKKEVEAKMKKEVEAKAKAKKKAEAKQKKVEAKADMKAILGITRLNTIPQSRKKIKKRTHSKSLPSTGKDGISSKEAKKGWKQMGNYYDKDGWEIVKKREKWFRTGKISPFITQKGQSASDWKGADFPK